MYAELPALTEMVPSGLFVSPTPFAAKFFTDSSSLSLLASQMLPVILEKSSLIQSSELRCVNEISPSMLRNLSVFSWSISFAFNFYFPLLNITSNTSSSCVWYTTSPQAPVGLPLRIAA